MLPLLLMSPDRSGEYVYQPRYTSFLEAREAWP